MRDSKVQSVTRAIELLKLIADHPSGVSGTELARLTSLHTSTVSRLIITLEASEVIQRVDGQASVQINPLFASRFITSDIPNTLIHIARPFLEALSHELGEASSVVISEGDQAVYLEQVSPNSAIQVRDWTGSRFPLHTVSAGKLLLAFRSPNEQNAYLSQPLAAYTQNTDTNPDHLRQSLAEISRTGLSWVFDEFTDGISGVAAPIYNRDDEVVAALNLYGPSFRFPNKQNIETINRLITEYADRCSKQLGTMAVTTPQALSRWPFLS